jgi:hypothetical protein
MGKKSTTQKTSERAFVTVKLKDRMAAVPEVRDGKVGDLTVCEYVTSLPEGKLVEQVISLGKQFKDFKDFFAAHVEWIHELRSRIPSRGYACKINLVDADDNTKSLSWSEFCLEIFGVSARWVSKLMANYQGMADQPDIDQPEVTDEGGDGEKKESPLAESRRHLEETEGELETTRTQTSNLRHELGNILSKIEDFRKGKIAAGELHRAADACRLRVVPPHVAGRDMETSDESFDQIGTDELLEELEEVVAKGAAVGGDK